METNDRMIPGAYDLPDAYRCIDCEALLSNISRLICDECEKYYDEEGKVREYQ